MAKKDEANEPKKTTASKEAAPKKEAVAKTDSKPKKAAAPKKTAAPKKAMDPKPKAKKTESASALQYAIIQTGSKQYKVAAGDLIDVELLQTQEGNTVEFTDVLLYHDGKAAKVGTPVVSGVKVSAEVMGEVRGPKVINYKYKRRKNYHRKVGHRQNYSRVKITSLTA